MLVGGLNEESRRRIRRLVETTDFPDEAIAWTLGLTLPAVQRAIALEGMARPEPDLAALVARVRGASASPGARWGALVQCLWGLVSVETQARTGRVGEDVPALSPEEVRLLMRGAATIEAALAQATAALAKRDGEGGGHDGPGADLAELRQELARRVAAAHRAAHDAGLARGAAGAEPRPPDP